MARWIPYIGAAFTVAIACFLLWRIAAAPVHVPKPRQQTAVIELQVCGWPLETVERWVALLPMCSFRLHLRAPEDDRCGRRPPDGNVLLQAPSPQRGDHQAAATTLLWMATEDGLYRTPEIHDGEPVDRPVGRTAGALAIVPHGSSDLVGAHELGHVCGYDHAVQGAGSHLWAPGQVMSAKTTRQGHGTKGMRFSADQYEPDLIRRPEL